LRTILHNIFLGINIFFAFSLLVSYLAAHINPEHFVLPAFFGLAYPYLLLINVIIAITWAVSLRYEAFISVVVIALGLTHFSNYIKIIKPKTNRDGTFKVMSYNLGLFNYNENSKDAETEQKVMALTKSIQPEIVCFQELYFRGDASLKAEEIKKALGGKYYSHLKLIGSGRTGHYGIATFSRYPIAGRGDIIHPGSSSMSIYTDIVINNDTFRLFNNHLQSFRLRRMERSLMEELSSSEDKQAMNEIKSLSRSLRRGFIRRARQAESLKENIKLSPYPVIVAGDFNDTPASFAYWTIRRGLNDSFVKSGYGAGFTYRGNYPPNRIDYILYDNNLVSKYFEIPKVKYSDHYPVVAWFRKPD
jgi:endonuclease/exonuclease/phosphatase family metal-dependent hydrolase